MPAQVIDLTDLAAIDGFIIQGDMAFDIAGNSVSNAGDVNGDGIDDLIVGAPRGGDAGTYAGEAYVIFGRTTGFGNEVNGRRVIDLSSLTPTDGFIVQSASAGYRTGASVSNAGDVNGDGIDDLIVGAYDGSSGGASAGETYVVFGRTTGFGSAVGGRQVLDLRSLSASDGFTIQGDEAFDRAGGSVSNAGDVNGDGIDDLIVGARYGDDGGDDAGEAYVIFGRTTGFGTAVGGRQVIDLSSLAASDGFIIQGDVAGDTVGRSVSTAGDINNDGIDDLIVGAPGGDDGGDRAGEAYVIFGRSSGFGTSINGRQVIDLTSLSATDGFIIQGDLLLNRAGVSVANAGDVNGDGIDDIVVGAHYGRGSGISTGEAYVIFGRTTGFGTTINGRRVIDLTTLSASDGFVIQGDAAFDYAGFSVSAAGDVNGDGFDDVIVGAFGGGGGGSTTGAAFVVFGRSTGFGTAVGGRRVLDLTDVAVSDALVILGDAFRDFAGYSVSAAGDVNGDGIDDLIVGAPLGDDGGTNAGEAYVIFGSRLFGLIPTDGTTGMDTLSGNAGSNVINGLGGNDVLNGRDGDDALNGGEGNDVLDGGTGTDRLRGGVGNDIYVIGDTADAVIERANEGTDSVETVLAAYTLTANVETLEYTGGAAFNGTGNALDNIIVGGGNADTLIGLDGNDTLVGEGGSDTLNGGNGSDRLIGGAGADTMNGEAGNDRLIVDNAGDVANGGTGLDTLEFSTPGLTYSIASDIEIISNHSGGALTVTLNARANTYGGSATGVDIVNAGAGQDTAYGRAGDDVLRGQNGNDYLFGEAGLDTLEGGDGIDHLYGGTETDILLGDAGNDTLYGEAGNDLITGGAGLDLMIGGAGADRFIFTAASDTGATGATADRISDFSQSQGDQIDLQEIDANSINGLTNEAFTFIGSGAFTNVAGQLRAVVSGGSTLVTGDIDGDGMADFMIRVDGVVTLTAADFSL